MNYYLLNKIHGAIIKLLYLFISINRVDVDDFSQLAGSQSNIVNRTKTLYAPALTHI